MIEGRKLAIYAFLTEIGACEAKMMVFDENPSPTYHELAFVLEAAFDFRVAGLIHNMLTFLSCADKRYFMERALFVAAEVYARNTWVDNTFRERFITLNNNLPVRPGDDDLPF